jgi:hypothetical protein
MLVFRLLTILPQIGGCALRMRRVLDWMIGFIAPYTFKQLGTTGNYSAIAILHTLQFTVTPTDVLGLLVLSWQRIHNTLSLQLTQSLFAQPHSFLAIILRLPIPKTRLSSSHLLPGSYPGRLGSRNWTRLEYCSLLLGRVRVRVALRLEVYRQSVRLGDKPLETHDHQFFSTEHLRS